MEFEGLITRVMLSGNEPEVYDEYCTDMDLLSMAECYHTAAMTCVYTKVDDTLKVTPVFVYLIRHCVELALKYMLSSDGVKVDNVSIGSKTYKTHVHNIETLSNIVKMINSDILSFSVQKFIFNLYHNDSFNESSRYPGQFELKYEHDEDVECLNIDESIYPITHVNVRILLHGAERVLSAARYYGYNIASKHKKN